MKKVIAAWYITLDATCPHCNQEVDLINDDGAVERENLPDPLERGTNLDIEAGCPHCGESFIVDSTEY